MRADGADLAAVVSASASLNLHARPARRVTYSRKIFLPLTNLCRDRCGYCVFVKGPSQHGAHTMTPDEVLAVAREGERLGCKEALFSLGDHPEWRHPEFYDTLRGLGGYRSTPEYVAAMCHLVLEETGIVPHTNCGTLSEDEVEMLAPWNASMGIMLESTSARLFDKGGAHYGTTSKSPALRVATIERAAGRHMAMTTGILIGIGETLEDRVDSLLLIRDVQERCGNVQEVIVQNFRAKPDTLMRLADEPETLDMIRTQAVARLLLGSSMNIQSPPNLNADDYDQYLRAGINDWGGVSPLTKDFINPEAAWPEVQRLRAKTASAGFELRERLALYPEYVLDREWPVAPAVRRRIDALADADGLVRPELECL
jgi:FO synthase